MLKLQSEQEFYRALGRRLRKMRNKTKLSPYYMGRTVGVHGMLYSEMEQGRIHPTPYQIYCIMHRCAPDMLQRLDAELGARESRIPDDG